MMQRFMILLRALLLAAFSAAPAFAQEMLKVNEAQCVQLQINQMGNRWIGPGMAATTTGAALGDDRREMPATGHFSVTVAAPVSQMKAELGNGFIFDLDFQTIGALVMADVSAGLTVKPAGLVLPFDGPKPMLVPKYDAAAKTLEIRLGTGGTLSSTRLELRADRATRVCLRQRNQVALFVIPPDGSSCTLAWCGRLAYRLRLMDAERYRLCRDVSVAMGTRELKVQDLVDGLKVEGLDELADIVVKGRTPLGKAFEHRYKADGEKLADAVGQVMDRFLHSLQSTPKAEAKP